MSSTTTTTELHTSLSTAIPDDEPNAHGLIRYVPAGHTPVPSPHNFHLPAISEFSDVRTMALHDMRPLPSLSHLASGTAQLSTHGFTALRHPSAMHSNPYSPASWKNPELLKSIYVPEVEDMLKRITGAKTVVTEAALLRSAVWSEADALATHAGHGKKDDDTAQNSAAPEPVEAEEETNLSMPQFIGFSPKAGGASPAPKVHLDYAPKGAREHIRKYHPDLTDAAKDVISAEERLLTSGVSLKASYAATEEAPRWALFSIWRPLKRVKRDPLALGDARTFRQDDYVPVVVKSPNLGVEGTETHMVESYLGRWSEGQKWWWVSSQEPEEVLVIGLYDSERERESVAAGGTLHSSVELPGTENVEARESLEVRCLAVW